MADSTSTSYRAPKELDWTGGDPCAVVLRLDTQAAFAVACGMQKFWGDKDEAPKQLFRAVCDFEGVDAGCTGAST